MFAFSTCWNSDRHIDGAAMLREIAGLGFTNIELSHGIRVSLIEGIQKALEKDPRLRVSSLHNYCPLPVGYIRSAPNVYDLSSERSSERAKAVRATIATMDFAEKMETRHIVLHLGGVRMKDPVEPLMASVAAGRRDTPEHRALVERARRHRDVRGRGAFAHAMKSLAALVEEARLRNLVLGVESRARLDEIPSESEMERLLAEFPPEHLGYWHDTGHVQMWENLGLADHAAWLKKFQGRLVGAHLHDVIWPEHDHQLPGDGSAPFDRLTALRADLPKVFEIHPGIPGEVLPGRLGSFMKKLAPLPP
ncbi:MAG: TIM barrel protein [Verrucomicrobiae bacterium]|nr:TIM barrel protein [Verrucomicrobiae bacterium]